MPRLMAIVLAALAIAGWAARADAAHSNWHQTVTGIEIYLGVVSAAIARGHPKTHAERAMHGGTASGDDVHVMVALFDGVTGERINDAYVEARIARPGRSSIERKLEEMTVAGAVTYGNYFLLPNVGRYRIDIDMFRTESGDPVHAHFVYERRPPIDRR